MIEEARRRQQRQRTVAALAVALAAAAAGVTVALAGGSGSRQPSHAPRSPSPVALAGRPLGGATHLRLIVSENAGRVYLVDVDTRTARALPIPGLRRSGQAPLRELASGLIAVPGGVEATVRPPPCQPCTVRTIKYLVGAGGSVRRLATVVLRRDQYTSTAAFDSTRTWVLTWPQGGRCTLSLEPGAGRAVAAPCGSLELDTAQGLVESTRSAVLLIDPRSGRVLERVRVSGQFDLLSGGIALTSTSPSPIDGSFPTDLTLVKLASGARRHLAWPSILHFGYAVFPEPAGRLAAVEFLDPAYTPHGETIGQASDVWLLDPASGRFTHVPGFPILEAIKFSDIAWTADDRLVIVAEGPTRTTLAVWRPGARFLRARTVPNIEGYSELVPLAG